MPLFTDYDNQLKLLAFTVTGRFDYWLYDAFYDACDSAAEITDVAVDLHQTDYFDSSALGILLMVREQVGSNVSITLHNPSPIVLQTLQTANFDKIFLISTGGMPQHTSLPADQSATTPV